jgi:hypothetical protein
VVAADVCPEFGVVAALTADALLLLKVLLLLLLLLLPPLPPLLVVLNVVVVIHISHMSRCCRRRACQWLPPSAARLTKLWQSRART